MAEDQAPAANSAWPEGTPPPGSDAAAEQGCKCPVLDNNRGRRAPVPPFGWYINAACTMHGAGR